jgi:hypothetical protein
MLRITVHEDGTLCRLELAGRLWGPWVAETEKAWHSALSSHTKQIEIDMKDVTAVDDKGRELLTSMHQAGAHLVAQGVEMTLVSALSAWPTSTITRSCPSTVKRLAGTVTAVTDEGGIIPGNILSQRDGRAARLLCICAIVPAVATTLAPNRSANNPAANQ